SSSVQSSSRPGKDAMAQQIKSSLTIGLAFEELETMNMTLHLPLTPLVRQSGQDGVLVALDPFGKSSQFWNSTLSSFFQPGFQCGGIAFSGHQHEGLRQCASCFHLRMGLL